MFLSVLEKRNAALLETAFFLHQSGQIQPDTYIIDFDVVEENAKQIKQEADKYQVKLYFMLKQIGRIPEIGHKLMEIGYEGAVCVDYREALLYQREGIAIGHVGHLVQTPSQLIPEILSSDPEVITVFSKEKIQEIHREATLKGICQPILLRIIEEKDYFYPGQEGGFYISELSDILSEIEKLSGVSFGGITTFPAILYDDVKNEFAATKNVKTLEKALQFLEERGYKDFQINLPSGTCVESISLLSSLGATHGEPGHGLTGTTPYHAQNMKAIEKPAYVYVSEISHNLGEDSFCYGGGRYPRGHLQNALIGTDVKNADIAKVVLPSDDSIDYTFRIKGNFSVSETVLMAGRTQIFVTRSEVVLVSGIQKGNPKILGKYTSQGERIL